MSEQSYLDLMQYTLDHGVRKENRTGTDTIAIFDARLKFDLSKGDFPLYTTKAVDLVNVAAELDWFMSGSTQVRDLTARGCNIWNLWNDDQKNIGLQLDKRPIVKIKKNPVDPKVVMDQYDEVIAEVGDVLMYHAKMHNQLKLCIQHLESEEDKAVVRAIGKIWTEYFDHALRQYDIDRNNGENIKYFKKSMVAESANVLLLSPELLPPLEFVKHVQKAINYSHWLEAGFSEGHSIFSMPWALSGVYEGSQVLTSQNMIFLHRQELAVYLEADKKGPLKVWFEDTRLGERKPMFLFDKSQLKTHVAGVGKVRLYRKVKSINKKDTLALRYALGVGNLGPVYGKQFRSAPAIEDNGTKGKKLIEVDQVKRAIDLLKVDPDSRRNIIDLWNLSSLDRMRLMPCHYSVVFTTEPISVADARRFAMKCIDGKVKQLPKRKLTLKFKMRSNDLPIGNPYNVSSYALLLIRIASAVNMVPGDLIFDGDDCHIYVDQIDAVKEQLSRKPRPFPTYKVYEWNQCGDDIDKVLVDNNDIELIGYDPHPSIAMKVAK